MFESRMISFAIVLSIQIAKCSFLEDQDTKIHIRGVQCNASEKFIFKNYSCFAKSYSRTISTINVVLSAKKPLDNLFLFVQLFYKYGVIYRQVMKTPLIDVCGVLQKYKDHLLVNQLVIITNAHVPGLIHECPYKGLYVRNISLNPDYVPAIIPSGDYKYIQTLYYGNETVGLVNFIISVNSPDKHSFG